MLFFLWNVVMSWGISLSGYLQKNWRKIITRSYLGKSFNLKTRYKYNLIFQCESYIRRCFFFPWSLPVTDSTASLAVRPHVARVGVAVAHGRPLPAVFIAIHTASWNLNQLNMYTRKTKHYDSSKKQYSAKKKLKKTVLMQEWRSCESTCLPPIWPGFDSGTTIICGLSLLLVLVNAPGVFLRVLHLFHPPQTSTPLNSNSKTYMYTL